MRSWRTIAGKREPGRERPEEMGVKHMRLSDLTGRTPLLVAGGKDTTALGEVLKRLTYAYTVLGNLARNADEKPKAAFAEAQELILKAKKVLMGT